MTVGENARDQGYVLGHSDRELERLEQQATFFGDMTRDVLVRAGLAPGMQVLDLGCGVGDVSMIAADLVGADGAVTGIDISPDALAIAERRAKASGRAAGFRHSSIDPFDGFDGYDAIVGRFIMVHLPKARETLGRVVAGAKPGTIVAFAELDLSTVSATGETPLLNRCVQWIAEVYRRAGLDPNPGTGLFATFRAVGLKPQMYGMTRIGDGGDVPGFVFLAESVRSMLPMIEKLGIASAAEIEVETLLTRLLAEAEAADPCVFYPRFIGAWARVE
ncbi:MAG: class I SAM-dependent methyltransferase [Devosia nanyangense]|nr:class I SAM-dependent methyltransferase [Devosia nanyangense]